MGEVGTRVGEMDLCLQCLDWDVERRIREGEDGKGLRRECLPFERGTVYLEMSKTLSCCRLVRVGNAEVRCRKTERKVKTRTTTQGGDLDIESFMRSLR